MEHEPPSEVTQLLQVWRGGDRDALDALLPLVYKELRRVAHFQLRNERPNHTLQSAALVNEAYLRLVGLSRPQWESRTHFFAIAAQLMRQILVDYARRHGAAKRGGSVPKLSLDEGMMMSRRKDVGVVALDDALVGLAKIDSRQSRVVELRFFAGLSLEQISHWKLLRLQCNGIGRRLAHGSIGKCPGIPAYEHRALGADETDFGRSAPDSA